MVGRSPDGFKIITYLRDEMTSEVACSDKAEAEEILTALTSRGMSGAITTSDGSDAVEESLIAYDRAEMWIDGSMVALGLNPSDNG